MQNNKFNINIMNKHFKIRKFGVYIIQRFHVKTFSVYFKLSKYSHI